MEIIVEQPRLLDNPRPEVIVDFVFDSGLFFIKLENISNKPAYRVTIRFDRPLIGAAGKEISSLPLFRNIEFFAPRKEIIAFLDTSAALFNRETDAKISARVTYQDGEGTEYQTDIRHDLEIYREMAYVVRPRDQSRWEEA